MEKKGKREVVVSALQFACTDDLTTNVATAERLVRAAHAKGANIILIQELFEGYYFCQAQREDFFTRAKPYKGHPTILRMQKLAKELGVVIPVSFFEEANNAHYNSIAIIDADGEDLGLYRKSHIPDGPGYQEKFYFNPGDTGFKVFQTKFAKIGVAICWDQWFPEGARAMVLQGAEILFYPTAIGSEPQDHELDSRDHWKRVMQGHAGANLRLVIEFGVFSICLLLIWLDLCSSFPVLCITSYPGASTFGSPVRMNSGGAGRFPLIKPSNLCPLMMVFTIVFHKGKLLRSSFKEKGWLSVLLKGVEIGEGFEEEGVPLVASNRIGKEVIETEHGKSEIKFYGNSFIAGPTGEIVAAADDKDEAVLIAQFDLDQIKSKRHSWGIFRDRRPELYKVLLTLDGSNASS
ncbi:hypothetical protein G4B88_019031 [Cannabis sativa]|uniref:CN hydrolase domain-containing protein n=1 Tax=Cannabis sativa TaxID=3483 RepID=A0A7J6H0N3_CANSA|nr:hypothetical protein G4B88_019031 [Cannabis sativa]